jgi:hypothetical protein
MDAAYDKWNNQWKGVNYEEFVNRLDYAERLAVLTGNLNYQVENGGWVQWFDNRYGKEAPLLRQTLLPYCERFESVAAVARIMDTAVIRNKRDEEEENFDDLDTEYYDIGDTFLKDVEVILSEVTAAK